MLFSVILPRPKTWWNNIGGDATVESRLCLESTRVSYEDSAAAIFRFLFKEESPISIKLKVSILKFKYARKVKFAFARRSLGPITEITKNRLILSFSSSMIEFVKAT